MNNIHIVDIPEEERLEINKRGVNIAGYSYSRTLMRPHLGPVLAESGAAFTRCELRHPEHPHQRSVFIGVGDVNGVDFWNQAQDCGNIIHQRFLELSGAGFIEANRWERADGTPVVDEQRAFRIEGADGLLTVNIEIAFTASYGKVGFGATKEAGPLGIRVADSIRADRGGGRIRNAEGLEGEEGCWGKCSAWCEYSACIDGQTLRIKVFDAPSNERHPTAWHVRNYGLMAANNLFFKGGLTIPDQDALAYRYRIEFSEEPVRGRT